MPAYAFRGWDLFLLGYGGNSYVFHETPHHGMVRTVNSHYLHLHSNVLWRPAAGVTSQRCLIGIQQSRHSRLGVGAREPDTRRLSVPETATAILFIYIYKYICTPGACVGPTETYPGLGGAYPLLKLWVGVCAACRVGRQGLARYAGCPAVRSGPASRGRYCRTKGDIVVEDLPVANSKGVWGVGPGEECPPFRVRVRVRVRTPYVMKRAGRFISIPPKGLEHNNHLPTD